MTAVGLLFQSGTQRLIAAAGIVQNCLDKLCIVGGKPVRNTTSCREQTGKIPTSPIRRPFVPCLAAMLTRAVAIAYQTVISIKKVQQFHKLG
ncbi:MULTISPECIES: hypothetical protein [unclassified Mesorhizobium]|uniref:hypothetical protein n=1 Tax=unclassified Mesorhizobium TaxID=325217 RepID=UPI00112EE3CE|nr:MULTISPECIES: hypothetical protein [unclassified Mesorhizobium]TPL16880.1 hypothetical protein FJ952_17275 [Mesorhizobium sp. B2-4-10]TPM16556.1 hypothetical protein FJ953_21120 [Mesorhizobium sp. B2-3-6]